MLLLSLCAELATEGRDPLSRRLAGLILKNHLDSLVPDSLTSALRIIVYSRTCQDEAKAVLLANAWLAVDGNTREQIKLGVRLHHAGLRPHSGFVQLLQTLGSPVPEARHTSAQVVAKVAKIELPSNLWPTLVDTLLKGTVESPDDNTKQAALEALGYVCEEVVRASSPSAHNFHTPRFE